MRRFLIMLSCVCFVSTAVSSAEVVGQAVVVDGDTLEIDGKQYRLLGIDAPEAAQTLPLATGGQDFFGRGAALVLRSMLEDREIKCQTHDKRDTRGALLATCFSGQTNLAAAMVERGMAWSSPEGPAPYKNHEDAARENKRGFWRDQLERPWFYRRRMQFAAGGVAPKGCAFKATVDSKGVRVYFAPWSPWYRNFKVDTSKGDKWFCSEAEAIAAGWKEPLFLMSSIVAGVYNP